MRYSPASEGRRSLHRQIWAKLNHVSMVEPRVSPPDPNATGAVPPTCTWLWAGPHLYPGPSQLHSVHWTWVVSGFCSPFQKPPWGVLFPKGKTFHWSSQKQRHWALRAGYMGANIWGTHSWMAELTFQSSTSLPAPASPSQIRVMLRDRKNENLQPKSQSPISRQASDTQCQYIIWLSSFH